MRHNYAISRNGIFISPLSENNIELMRILRNKERNHFFCSDYISAESQTKWFQQYLEKHGDYMFEIALEEAPNDFIGVAALYNVDETERSAEFGRLVLDRNRVGGRGLGKIVTHNICIIGFEQLNIDTIYLSVFANNISALRTYEDIGFSLRHDQVLNMNITKSQLQKFKG